MLLSDIGGGRLPAKSSKIIVTFEMRSSITVSCARVGEVEEILRHDSGKSTPSRQPWRGHRYF